jgi:hypothetical protein
MPTVVCDMATFSLLNRNRGFEGTRCFHLQDAGPAVMYTIPVSQMRLLKYDARRTLLRAGFDARSVHVGFVVDMVLVGKVFLEVRWFFPVRIIPSVLHIYSSPTIYYLSS